MKNLKLVTIILASVFLVMGSSCKYEESGLSLRSKKARVVNIWKVESPSPGSENLRIEFEKDGSGSVYDNTAPSAKNELTWKFDDTKEYLLVTTSGSTEQKIKILKLKHKSLWLGDDVADAEKYVSE